VARPAGVHHWQRPFHFFGGILMKDKLYPIYRVCLEWIQDDTKNYREKYDSAALRNSDLPPGRIRDANSVYNMYREEKDLTCILDNFKTVRLNHEDYKDKNLVFVTHEIKLVLYESWCPSWFSHWTFDDGQSDHEAIMSFERYIQRMETYNSKNGKMGKFGWEDAICLMGAEDRWRWKGRDDNDNETEPPCRCAGCKTLGVIRIMH
jgi:hypothetical protein